MTGVFISLEGIEGSGKSTQQKKISDYLLSLGHQVCQTREPGGTPFGQHLRDLLLSTKSDFQSKFTEPLLFTADRLEHIETVIKPALARGEVVLCDRFCDSTIAYQEGGRQLPREFIRSMVDVLPIMPIRTLLFDLPAEEGISRAKGRGLLDRFEAEEIAFHHRVREKYLEIAKESPERISIISVQNKSEDTIFQDVSNVVLPLIENVIH